MKTKLISRLSILCMAILCTGLSSQHFGHDNTAENDLATDEQFATIEAQQLALYEYYKKAITIKKNKGEYPGSVVATNKEYLKRFFKALPRDFETFFKIYVGCLYDDGYSYSINPWGTFSPYNQKRCSTVYGDRLYIYDLEDIFPALQKVIPEEIYYKKLLSMGCGGEGGGFCDGDGDAACLQEYLLELVFQNLALSAKVLGEKTDNEIAGLWYFLYDGPHPDNYQEEYNVLYAQLKKLNPRIAQLMKTAYDRLLSEEHCPGH